MNPQVEHHEGGGRTETWELTDDQWVYSPMDHTSLIVEHRPDEFVAIFDSHAAAIALILPQVDYPIAVVLNDDDPQADPRNSLTDVQRATTAARLRYWAERLEEPEQPEPVVDDWGVRS